MNPTAPMNIFKQAEQWKKHSADELRRLFPSGQEVTWAAQCLDGRVSLLRAPETWSRMQVLVVAEKIYKMPFTAVFRM